MPNEQPEIAKKSPETPPSWPPEGEWVGRSHVPNNPPPEKPLPWPFDGSWSFLANNSKTELNLLIILAIALLVWAYYHIKYGRIF